MRWLAVLLLLLVVAVLGTTELKVDAAGHAVDPPNTDRRGAQANSCRAPPRPSLPGSPGSQILWSNLATDRRELLETLTLLAHSGGGFQRGSTDNEALNSSAVYCIMRYRLSISGPP